MRSGSTCTRSTWLYDQVSKNGVQGVRAYRCTKSRLHCFHENSTLIEDSGLFSPSMTDDVMRSSFLSLSIRPQTRTVFRRALVVKNIEMVNKIECFHSVFVPKQNTILLFLLTFSGRAHKIRRFHYVFSPKQNTLFLTTRSTTT